MYTRAENVSYDIYQLKYPDCFFTGACFDLWSDFQKVCCTAPSFSQGMNLSKTTRGLVTF